jgi:hypothetical protein
VINFVAAHLELKNTLDRAKAGIYAAAKGVQAETRPKSKTSAAKSAPKPEPAKASEIAKTVRQSISESPRAAGLFDSPEPMSSTGLDREEEISDEDQGEFGEDEDGADEAA